MHPQDHGLILQPPVIGKDYIFGASGNPLTGEILLSDGDWRPFLPEGELQSPKFETNSCASQGTEHALRSLQKYLTNEEINLSARFIAKGSGTDPLRGNTPNNVAQFVRRYWAPTDERYPDECADVHEYYQDIPSSLWDEAKVLQGDWIFGYDYVTPSKANLKEALRRGTVGMSVAAWAQDGNGEYYRPQGWADNHFVQLAHIDEKGRYHILDTYEPFIKIIRADFTSSFAYRYTMNEKQVDTLIQILRRLREWLARL